MVWINEFEDRLERFQGRITPKDGEIVVSIKVRVDGGCYGRGCCPHAYKIIDRKLMELRREDERLDFEEHETGPEIIAYIVLGLTLANSVIELVTTIIKARSEGQKHGDRHHEPVTLILRRVEKPDTLIEERLLTFDSHDEVTSELIKQALLDGAKKITDKSKKSKPSNPKKTRRRRP